MEPTIAVLPPHVIDQIAAGEVIERPASVVKELLDNAIDAGATTITIDVAGGGRGLVRVTDDGHGMSAKAAVLALERHATSKLRAVEDLWGLTSMGFRGEALPSIASVSRMTLTTRRASDDAATRIVIDTGRLVSVTEVGAAVGTTVEVADLLHNLPARLKFLKGEATEASHVTELVGRVAMAFPRLHLRLRHNGRTALDVPPDRDGFARAQALLGPRVAARMLPVVGEESGVRVTGYLGAPELAQATARSVQLFVGRRPVRDRNLLHALAMGYGELIPRGRYPVAIILVDAPAGTVDINVHPQKLEVRFSDAAIVAAAVRHIVQAGVHAAHWRDEAAGAGPVQMIATVAPPVLPFDGRPVTSLAERHAADMRSRQVSLGFAASPTVPAALPPSDAGASSGSARAWARALREQTRAGRVDEPGPGELAGWLRPGEPVDSPTASWPAPGSRYPTAESLVPSDQPSRLKESSESADSSSSEAAAAVYPLADADLGSPAPALVSSAAGSSPHHAADAATQSPYGSPGSPVHDAADPAGPPYSSAIGSPARGVATASSAYQPAAALPLALPVTRVPGFFTHLRYLGQLDLTYLVCDGDGELVLVDQHAAHERVELARLHARQHTASGADVHIAVQKLLFPVTFEATPEQIDLVGRVGDVLAQVGFEIEPFGRATLAVKAVPASLRHGDPAQLLRMLLERWAEAGAPSEAERLDTLLGEIACHSAVRAGDRLSAGEAETLLRSLDGVDLSLPAPHGRAVLLRLPLSEIGRRFGR